MPGIAIKMRLNVTADIPSLAARTDWPSSLPSLSSSVTPFLISLEKTKHHEIKACGSPMAGGISGFAYGERMLKRGLSLVLLRFINNFLPKEEQGFPMSRHIVTTTATDTATTSTTSTTTAQICSSILPCEGTTTHEIRVISDSIFEFPFPIACSRHQTWSSRRVWDEGSLEQKLQMLCVLSVFFPPLSTLSSLCNVSSFSYTYCMRISGMLMQLAAATAASGTRRPTSGGAF